MDTDYGLRAGDREGASDRGDGGNSARGRLRSRAAALFSVRAFVVALAAASAGVFAGGMIPLIGPVGGVVGVFLAGFVLALAGWRRYAEVGLAGGAAVGVATLLDALVLALAGLGTPVVAVGAGVGALAGLAGHYFGRDLRDGLTRPV